MNTRLLKHLYFLPMLIMTPIRGFQGGCDGYSRYQDLSLGGHIFGCCLHIYMGLFEGAFIGMIWPISGIIAAKRYIDNK